MESKEILDKIEDIISKQVDDLDNASTDSDKSTLKSIGYLMFQFFLKIIKAPFNFANNYIKGEIIKSIKKDAKLYALIMITVGILFIFFAVIWLFIAIAISAYFYEKGHTLFNAIVYSIGIQLIAFIGIGLTALIASKKIKSLQLMKKIFNTKN